MLVKVKLLLYIQFLFFKTFGLQFVKMCFEKEAFPWWQMAHYILKLIREKFRLKENGFQNKAEADIVSAQWKAFYPWLSSPSSFFHLQEVTVPTSVSARRTRRSRWSASRQTCRSVFIFPILQSFMFDIPPVSDNSEHIEPEYPDSDSESQ